MLEPMSPPRKPDDDAKALPTIIRIPEATRERLRRVADAMAKRALAELPASVVVRAVLERGLDALERELGLTKERKT